MIIVREYLVSTCSRSARSGLPSTDYHRLSPSTTDYKHDRCPLTSTTAADEHAQVWTVRRAWPRARRPLLGPAAVRRLILRELPVPERRSACGHRRGRPAAAEDLVGRLRMARVPYRQGDGPAAQPQLRDLADARHALDDHEGPRHDLHLRPAVAALARLRLSV